MVETPRLEEAGWGIIFRVVKEVNDEKAESPSTEEGLRYLS